MRAKSFNKTTTPTANENAAAGHVDRRGGAGESRVQEFNGAKPTGSVFLSADTNL